MSENERALFSNDYLSDMFDQVRAQVREKIEGESADYLLNVNEENYCDHLLDTFQVQPVTLDRSATVIADQGERQVAVQDFGETVYPKRSYYVFSVPFAGPRGLFFYRPSSFTLNPPHAAIGTNELTMTLIDHRDSAETINHEVESRLNSIEKYLATVRSDVEEFNAALPGFIRTAFKWRKDKHAKAANILASLNYPLKKRDDTPSTFAVPMTRKRIVVQRPAIKSGGRANVPHPAIDEQIYNEILEILHNMVLVMERSPKAFSEMGEEDLRTHFLVQLNGTFKGEGTGETFNYAGKTDILLRHEGRNLFIAECKFWRGAKEFIKTIDQLLGYLTWRDSKTAILVFVRDEKISTVAGKIPDLLRSHSNFIAITKPEQNGEIRVKMHTKTDANLEVFVAVQWYHVPVAP
jgi:hypothetical protein